VAFQKVQERGRLWVSASSFDRQTRAELGLCCSLGMDYVYAVAAPLKSQVLTEFGVLAHLPDMPVEPVVE
jgi:hypothetical protein